MEESREGIIYYNTQPFLSPSPESKKDRSIHRLIDSQLSHPLFVLTSLYFILFSSPALSVRYCTAALIHALLIHGFRSQESLHCLFGLAVATLDESRSPHQE